VDEVGRARQAKESLTKQDAVPDAPFKQSWHELVMKRMLRHAAENGYDQLAWTTGKQQAYLYGLEHHFSKLEYDPKTGELNGYDLSGHNVVNESVNDDVESLSAYMPQELAENLANKIQDYHDNPPDRFDEEAAYEYHSSQYDIEENEPEEEGGDTTYTVTTEWGDKEGPFDTQRQAERYVEEAVNSDVQSDADSFEPEKSEHPALTGLNLVHGGEFHKLLYDKMIPSFLKKYAKKWGAEVGTTEIKGMAKPEVDYTGPTKTLQELNDIKDNGGISGQEVLPYSQMQVLKQIIADMKRGIPFRDAMLGGGSDSLAEQLGGKFLKTPANAPVHSIPITPEMRKSVMKQGQPIAKSEQPDRKKIFGSLSTALA
jgi:hypothetical protein